MKVASKNAHRMKVQFANAASECTEALNRTFRKVHSEKAAPCPDASVMSTSMKATWLWLSPDRSRLSQSSDRMVVWVSGAGLPCLRSGTPGPRGRTAADEPPGARAGPARRVVPRDVGGGE